MKSKFLKKLCIYAISESMILPASAPVMATTTTSVVRDYSFNLSEMNYTNAVLYEGDSLQLRTTHPASKINKLPGRLTWISSNPKVVSVSSSGKITAKKTTTTGAFRPSKAFSVITLKKGNVEIAKCAVDVMPQLQFSTKTRTAKKGTTLKVCVPDYASNCKSSNKSVVKVDDRFWRDEYGYDKNGKHYFDLKCLKKGTSTITFTVRGNSSKNNYRPQKTFKFKVTVK